MTAAIELAAAHDAPELKRLIAKVIAESVTREEPVYSEMTTNAVGNVDWWITHGRGVHLKATERNRIVGVVLVKEYWNLCSLFVDPSMQKQGIGKVLLSTAIASCLGKSPYNAVRLNAAPAAVPFYARHGFTPLVPTRPLPPGFAAMELRFDGQASEHQNTSTGLSFKR